ncbi:MAG: hypothetical protein U1E60_19945 [Reyranellaceae bacterium]
MPRIVIVKTDTTLRALGPTLLDARFRGDQVDAALERLKALNPHADPERIAAGTILFVPDTPAFKASASTTPQAQPLDDFRAMLTTALSDSATRLKGANAARAAERADLSTVLKSATFKRAAGDDADVAKQVSDAQKAAATEETEDKQAEETLAAMSKAALAALAQITKIAG